MTPRYDQIAIRSLAKENSLYQVLSPNKEDDGVWIHQNAWFNIGEYEKSTTETYSLHQEDNGVYLFVIEGNVNIHNHSLEKEMDLEYGIQIRLNLQLKNPLRFF